MIDEALTAEQLGRVHLVGVGGVGMSALARLLLTRGIQVSGSELRSWPALAGLRALGGVIHMTHEVSNLDGVDTVVYSSAIPKDQCRVGALRAQAAGHDTSIVARGKREKHGRKMSDILAAAATAPSR